MSVSEAAAALARAAELLDRAAGGGETDVIDDAHLQALLAAAVRAYAARRDRGAALPIFGSESEVTATDVAVTASAMMEAVNMAVFELGMWQTLKGPRGH